MSRNLAHIFDKIYVHNRVDILPQVELVCAVLEQAIGQVSGKIACSDEDKDDATRFIYSKRLECFIDKWNLDIEPKYIRRITDKQIKLHENKESF